MHHVFHEVKKTITVHWNLPIHWNELCEILKQQCLNGGFLTPKCTVVRCLPYYVCLYSLSLPSFFFCMEYCVDGTAEHGLDHVNMYVNVILNVMDALTWHQTIV